MLQELIKSAMIGNSKYVPTAIPAVLQEAHERMQATSENREDAFLKLTAAYLLMEEAGKTLPQSHGTLPPAPSETRPFVPATAAALLQQFLRAKEEVLIDYFIHRCNTQNKVVLPALLPELLARAADKKQKRTQTLQACGTRGAWLAGINPQWQHLNAPAEDQVWETGTWEQRKAYLREIRQTAPDAALALLEASLQEETANNRAELLGILLKGLSLADEAFLIAQLDDKSSKVKQVVYELLQSLPGSGLYQEVAAFVKSVLTIKEERTLLFTKKKVPHLNREAALPETLVAAGLEKVSSQPGVEDMDFWLAQAIACLHPDFWQAAYQLSPKEVVQLFTSHKAQNLWVPYLVQSAVRYSHRELAQALLESDPVNVLELLPVLPLQERFRWADKFIAQQAYQYLYLLLDEGYTLIPASVCTALLQQLVQQPYSLSQQDYLRWALQMPPSLLPVLQQYILQENEAYQVRYFRNMCTEMSRIIQTREQLNASI
ncbi:DUF5691 domain-containing protein [Pontibacter chinhatensis]|uniref:Uncharacterized protein n=1 Tax=Pontibacter chinhatensis TaxID=1436961 RepID=A0A1I2Z4A1_9BACT|nr:DUF5691 domain-containing protein [Pontibacter chinhatensis]SFH32405.1 hypothetical protein SAMN05421739_11148 [Pontibacter chinhatensis]